jgi:hypothetical protein
VDKTVEDDSDRDIAARYNIGNIPGPRRHSQVVVNVEKRDLSQAAFANHENCVEKFVDLGNVKQVDHRNHSFVIGIEVVAVKSVFVSYELSSGNDEHVR